MDDFEGDGKEFKPLCLIDCLDGLSEVLKER